jgi:hypothetical protein
MGNPCSKSVGQEQGKPSSPSELEGSDHSGSNVDKAKHAIVNGQLESLLEKLDNEETLFLFTVFGLKCREERGLVPTLNLTQRQLHELLYANSHASIGGLSEPGNCSSPIQRRIWRRLTINEMSLTTLFPSLHSRNITKLLTHGFLTKDDDQITRHPNFDSFISNNHCYPYFSAGNDNAASTGYLQQEPSSSSSTPDPDSLPSLALLNNANLLQAFQFATYVYKPEDVAKNKLSDELIFQDFCTAMAVCLRGDRLDMLTFLFLLFAEQPNPTVAASLTTTNNTTTSTGSSASLSISISSKKNIGSKGSYFNSGDLHSTTDKAGAMINGIDSPTSTFPSLAIPPHNSSSKKVLRSPKKVTPSSPTAATTNTSTSMPLETPTTEITAGHASSSEVFSTEKMRPGMQEENCRPQPSKSSSLEVVEVSSRHPHGSSNLHQEEGASSTTKTGGTPGTPDYETSHKGSGRSRPRPNSFDESLGRSFSMGHYPELIHGDRSSSGNWVDGSSEAGPSGEKSDMPPSKKVFSGGSVSTGRRQTYGVDDSLPLGYEFDPTSSSKSSSAQKMRKPGNILSMFTGKKYSQNKLLASMHL